MEEQNGPIFEGAALSIPVRADATDIDRMFEELDRRRDDYAAGFGRAIAEAVEDALRSDELSGALDEIERRIGRVSEVTVPDRPSEPGADIEPERGGDTEPEVDTGEGEQLARDVDEVRNEVRDIARTLDAIAASVETLIEAVSVGR